MSKVEIDLMSALTIYAVMSEEYELLTSSSLGDGADNWINMIKTAKTELFDGIMTYQIQPNEQNIQKDGNNNS